MVSWAWIADHFTDLSKLIGGCHHPHIPRRREAGDGLWRERAQRGEALVFGCESGHWGLGLAVANRRHD